MTLPFITGMGSMHSIPLFGECPENDVADAENSQMQQVVSSPFGAERSSSPILGSGFR